MTFKCFLVIDKMLFYDNVPWFACQYIGVFFSSFFFVGIIAIAFGYFLILKRERVRVIKSSRYEQSGWNAFKIFSKSLHQVIQVEYLKLKYK